VRPFWPPEIIQRNRQGKYHLLGFSIYVSSVNQDLKQCVLLLNGGAFPYLHHVLAELADLIRQVLGLALALFRLHMGQHGLKSVLVSIQAK
jgi:hypothetical protein